MVVIGLIMINIRYTLLKMCYIHLYGTCQPLAKITYIYTGCHKVSGRVNLAAGVQVGTHQCLTRPYTARTTRAAPPLYPIPRAPSLPNPDPRPAPEPSHLVVGFRAISPGPRQEKSEENPWEKVQHGIPLPCPEFTN